VPFAASGIGMAGTLSAGDAKAVVTRRWADQRSGVGLGPVSASVSRNNRPRGPGPTSGHCREDDQRQDVHSRPERRVFAHAIAVSRHGDDDLAVCVPAFHVPQGLCGVSHRVCPVQDGRELSDCPG
jgi:hypothetical protein